MKHMSIALALFVFLAGAGTLGAFHDGDHGDGPLDRTFKIGKTGEVNIGRDVKIGGTLVRRGKYVLTHQAEESRHVFVLTEVNKKKDASQLSTIELASQFVSHPERVKKSAVLAKEQPDRSYVVLNVLIAGENGDHLFSTNIGGNNATASKKN